VVNDRGRFVLHSVPSGIFSPGTLCVIGAGCVVDPVKLVAELESLAARGVDADGLLISERAHLILHYHRVLEGIEEQWRSPDERIAPTGQGACIARCSGRTDPWRPGVCHPCRHRRSRRMWSRRLARSLLE
jgi:adenylosuccinate synthase